MMPVLIVTTLLIGTSEVKAVLYSAVLFSLLHSVNFLACFPVSSLFVQLVNTFIHVVAAGCLMVKT